MLSNPLLIGGEDNYQIQRSLRLRASATAYLSRTFGATGSQRTWTLSMWFKRGNLATDNQMLFGGRNVGWLGMAFNADRMDFYQYNAAYQMRLLTTAVFRDPSAWYHVVFAVDTTQATAANRIRLYVNGVEQTAFSSTTYPAQNYDLSFNVSSTAHYLASYEGTNPFDGYIAEVNFVNAAQLTPSNFGQTDPTTGQWTAKKYTGSYGTNGFYINFSDNSALTTASNVGLGKDFSGNGNYWVTNNVSITAGATYDSMLDVPLAYGTTDRGNFATLNPLHFMPTGNVGLFSNANLTGAPNGAEGTVSTSFVTTQPLPSTGKWYWEVTPSVVATMAATRSQIGVMGRAQINYAFTSGAGTTDCFAYCPTGQKSTNVTQTSYGATYVANDVIGVAVDLDNGAIYFAKNGTWQNSGDPTSGATKTGAAFTTLVGANEYYPAIGYWITAALNFGQRPFTYTPPTGFKALHTGNLPAATIQKPNKNFDVVTRTGTGASYTKTGLPFAPDFAWIKDRSVARSHRLFDTIRGATNGLFTDATSAESVLATDLTAFTSDGYTLGAGTGSNGTGETYVDWLWKAGGSAVTNTAGSISAQVSANPSAGFSIVTYTSTRSTSGVDTIGHGLGVAPKLVISKSRNLAGVDSGAWFVWHSASGSTDNYLRLNTTAAVASVSGGGGGTMVAPTSSVFSAPYISGASITGNNYVAYCFSEIAGYSKFGSYTGNGSADGPFVYCGFRPRWVLYKNTSVAGNWVLLDSARSPENVSDEWLIPNQSLAEQAQVVADLTANGFKIRATAGADLNGSGNTYIFAAFAEAPFQSALAR